MIENKVFLIITLTLFSFIFIDISITPHSVTRSSYLQGAFSFPPTNDTSDSKLIFDNESSINTTLAAETNRSFLKVIVRVNNATGAVAQPSDFTVDILKNSGIGLAHTKNEAHPDVFSGSAEGTISSIIPGTYSIRVNDLINGVLYSLVFSGNCMVKGLDVAEVVITPGDKVTCTVTATSPNF